MRFSKAILGAKREGRIPVIAEIKARTPKDGDLLRGRDPVDLAKEMEATGAAALSVVTQHTYFGGDLQTLRNVVGSVRVPVLRKDFIRTEEQVYESKSSGADALLLISSIMPQETVSRLDGLSRRLGMETVVEVHNAREMKAVLKFNPRIIGINNRDILRLETDPGDVGTTERLARLAPSHVLLISESSIETKKDAERAINAGADAILVGTALMKTLSIKRKLRELMMS